MSDKNKELRLNRGLKKGLTPRIVWTVVIGLLAFATMVPFFWMLSASMKYETDVMKLPIE